MFERHLVFFYIKIIQQLCCNFTAPVHIQPVFYFKRHILWKTKFGFILECKHCYSSKHSVYSTVHVVHMWKQSFKSRTETSFWLKITGKQEWSILNKSGLIWQRTNMWSILVSGCLFRNSGIVLVDKEQYRTGSHYSYVQQEDSVPPGPWQCCSQLGERGIWQQFNSGAAP